MTTLKGGRILGEGQDGCVLTEPAWPCARTGTSTDDKLPNPLDSKYVSKIVDTADDESVYLKAATRILGLELARQYSVHLKGECTPADSTHPPPLGQEEAYQSSKSSLLTWTKKDEACDILKQDLAKGKSITPDHKVLYISKYPITLDQWAQTKHVHLSSIHKALTPFIQIAQKLFQGNSEQLINLDLHAGNMYVRPLQDDSIQFGIADFGRSLLRQRHVAGSDSNFFGKYLCENTAVYDLYALYNQIPLEARLLNFCYKKSLEHSTPGDLVRAWQTDKLTIEHNGLKDAILYANKEVMDLLLTKPLFINMVEVLQVISRKLKQYEKDPTGLTQSLSQNEKTVLEFLITRYAIVSPINMIASVCMIASLNPIALIEFVKRAMIAPYIQVGSSLSAAVESVQGADMGIVWSDITRGR